MFLVLCGWVACEWELAPSRPAEVSASEWRRAKDGWRSVHWETPWQRYEPALHPATVVAFLVCASLLALLGLPAQYGRSVERSMANYSRRLGHQQRVVAK